IVVTTNGGPTTATTVTYTINAPIITKVVDNSNNVITMGPVGTPFTLIGTGFTGTKPLTGVSINSVAATNVVVVSDTKITGVIPSTTTGPTTIQVTTSGGPGSTPFNVTNAVAPSNITFSPSHGPVGTFVTISGSGFTGATKVTVGGVVLDQTGFSFIND